MANEGTNLEAVHRYHEETKHHPHRFARSLGYLDWATQPLPFRRFHGAPVIELPRTLAAQAVPRANYGELFEPGHREPARVNADSIGQLFRYSLGLSAWKEFGTERWALRVNPSSGNLHPTEGYAVLGPTPGLADTPCVYHYAPEAHALETRCRFSGDAWSRVAVTWPAQSFLVGLSSVLWRETWKYGERAFRYCQHDVGHAVAALRFAAALLGWQAAVLPGWGTPVVEGLLGLDRDDDFTGAERESAECLVIVGPNVASPMPLPGEAHGFVEAVAAGMWEGTASRLSPDHVEWPIIDEVDSASRAPSRANVARPTPAPSDSRRLLVDAPPLDAREIILQRRSALGFDREARCSLASLIAIMRRVLPAATPPWDVLWWPPAVHLAVFVHAVDGLDPGIYMLMRHAHAGARLRAAMRQTFSWTRAESIPADLPLFTLLHGDVRELAASLSCRQAIAGDSYFSLGMIADFEHPLAEYGSWFYRHLFWETGLVGQVLYLEAEAQGARGTGIGCFFDDGVHHALGLGGREFQSLYHFTVGKPVPDRRITIRPGYPWESDAPGRRDDGPSRRQSCTPGRRA